MPIGLWCLAEMTKTFLFVMRKPAHSGAFVRETLDIVLTTAAFDQTVSLLLLDDAVFNLKRGQHVGLGLRDTAAMFEALPLYEVNNIYVEYESLLERGMQGQDFILPVQAIARTAVSAFLAQFDVIFPC